MHSTSFTATNSCAPARQGEAVRTGARGHWAGGQRAWCAGADVLASVAGHAYRHAHRVLLRSPRHADAGPAADRQTHVTRLYLAAREGWPVGCKRDNEHLRVHTRGVLPPQHDSHAAALRRRPRRIQRRPGSRLVHDDAAIGEETAGPMRMDEDPGTVLLPHACSRGTGPVARWDQRHRRVRVATADAPAQRGPCRPIRGPRQPVCWVSVLPTTSDYSLETTTRRGHGPRHGRERRARVRSR